MNIRRASRLPLWPPPDLKPDGSAIVPDRQPNRDGGGPTFATVILDKMHLRDDLNISLQGCGIIGGRC